MQVKNVVIVNDFNYTQGGASKVAIDTARLLKANKYNVIFFSAVNNDNEKIDGVEYITTNQNEALKEKNKLKGIINGIYNFKAKKEFKKLLRTLDKNTTIIHVHGWTKALSSSVFDIAFKMKFKVVLTLHDYFTACPNGGYFDYKKNEICHLKPLSWKCIKCNCDSRNYMFKIYRIIRQFVQNKIVKLNDRLEYAIGVSDFSIRMLRKTLNKKIKIKKIYNPIDFTSVERKPVCNDEFYLYVGRISKEKGIELFCKAIEETKLKGIVVGDGLEKESLQRKYNSITFVGWKNRDEVKKYMERAEALIYPSLLYETAGLSIAEAQNIGLPVIVPDWCAGKEFLRKGCTFQNIEELKNVLQNKMYLSVYNSEVEQQEEKKYIEELKMFYESM